MLRYKKVFDSNSFHKEISSTALNQGHSLNIWQMNDTKCIKYHIWVFLVFRIFATYLSYTSQNNHLIRNFAQKI